MEKKGKVEGERERESQRLCSSEIRSYGLVVSLVCLWIQSKCVCLEAFPFSFSPLGTSLKAPQQWAEQSFHIQKRSLFPLACFFTPIRFHFLCFLLLYGPHVRLRASNGQMGWPPTHEHPLCSIPTTIISSPLCISLCVCVCVCRTRHFASATAQAFNSDTRAVKMPIKPVSAHHSIPKTKGLLVREETEPWSKSPSAASEYGKAHYAVRLSVLLAFTGLLTVYIVRRLFTRWSLGGV